MMTEEIMYLICKDFVNKFPIGTSVSKKVIGNYFVECGLLEEPSNREDPYTLRGFNDTVGDKIKMINTFLMTKDTWNSANKEMFLIIFTGKRWSVLSYKNASAMEMYKAIKWLTSSPLNKSLKVLNMAKRGKLKDSEKNEIEYERIEECMEFVEAILEGPLRAILEWYMNREKENNKKLER